MSEGVGDEYRRLNRAIKRADLAAIRREIDSGVSPNFRNRFGWTLLMLAAIEGNTAIGEFLISRGADVNKITSHGPGQTALSLTIIGGHARFLKLLLKHGANIAPGGVPVERWLAACHLNSTTEKEIAAAIEAARTKKME
jgi:ankyrin repeat protein